MGDYAPVELRRHGRLLARQTAENRYWDKFQFPVVVKEYGSVSHLQFSPVAPHDLCVSSSTRLLVYSSANMKVKKTFSRFKDIAYSGCFRFDGKLVAGGCETGHVKVFDVGSGKILRNFPGHGRPSRSVRFSADGLQVISGGDDGKVRCWDIPSENEVSVLSGHEDYVRTGCISPTSPHLYISGGYDHKVIVWDWRAGKSVMSFDHNYQVESLLCFPTGASIVSSGGNQICIWDPLTGKRLNQLSNHQKSITALAMNKSGTRLLSGSLDRQVKIYDVEDYSVVHSIKYPDQIVSLALSPADTHLAVGTANGTLSIRHRALTGSAAPSATKPRSTPRAGTYRFFARGRNAKPEPTDIVPHIPKKKKLSKFDKLLKAFNYHEALDQIFRGAYRATIVVSFLQELAARDALKGALSGRDEQTLQPVLKFVVQHIVNPRHSVVLIGVANLLLDLYAPGLGQSQEVDELFVKLATKLRRELLFQKNLFKLLGSLDCIMSCNRA